MFLNGVAQAQPTEVLYLTADEIPYSMTTPELVEVNPYNVTIKWKELTNYTNGRDSPIYYEL